MPEWIINADWSVLHLIQSRLTCGFLDFVMPRITMPGDMGAVWILAAVVLICMKKYRKYGILLLAGLALGVLVGNVALKHLIARPRPCLLETGVKLLIPTPTDILGAIVLGICIGTSVYIPGGKMGVLKKSGTKSETEI